MKAGPEMTDAVLAKGAFWAPLPSSLTSMLVGSEKSTPQAPPLLPLLLLLLLLLLPVACV